VNAIQRRALTVAAIAALPGGCNRNASVTQDLHCLRVGIDSLMGLAYQSDLKLFKIYFFEG
jgi:hypothetical protein